MIRFLILILVMLLTWALPAFAGTPLPGPISAEVIRVIDGDTVLVRARIWLDQELTVAVRINGVDTPELKSRCEAERTKARTARDWLAQRLPGGAPVLLKNIEADKYHGRAVADLYSGNISLAVLLQANALARAYSGGKRQGWC